MVRDTLNAGLAEPVMPEVYMPFTAAGMSNLLVVRTHGDPAGVTRAVVSQVYAIDQGQPVTGVMTLDAILRDGQYATPQIQPDPAVGLRRRWVWRWRSSASTA